MNNHHLIIKRRIYPKRFEYREKMWTYEVISYTIDSDGSVKYEVNKASGESNEDEH